MDQQSSDVAAVVGLRRCLSCHTMFPHNRALEFLPAGHRVAFDPVRGRLWIICDSCSRWTLVPFERRWEALEELERVCVDEARLLKQGENIALYHAREVARAVSAQSVDR